MQKKKKNSYATFLLYICWNVQYGLFIKRLVPFLDSDWSAAVFFSWYSRAMTASPNRSVYHWATPLATTLSDINNQ